ncbi:hypothetical protein CCACVL1_28668 [Corchorus capsularis]|uniref:Uncharacterized protein n=1 Tax=Corchorus capsularis TaxID=210143 RepID=A0A1R3G5N9_COCAP|nr:hypothetical protein CCACVL1_28668 [Corchorus capsularis]
MRGMRRAGAVAPPQRPSQSQLPTAVHQLHPEEPPGPILVEAERKVKEATLAKKRAKEALERLAFLARKENDRLKPSLATVPKSKSTSAVDTKTNAEKASNNGLYPVSAANAPIPIPKLQRQHSANGPN